MDSALWKSVFLPTLREPHDRGNILIRYDQIKRNLVKGKTKYCDMQRKIIRPPGVLCICIVGDSNHL